jgi:signal transduction histidine kinase
MHFAVSVGNPESEMISEPVTKNMPVTRRIEEVSGIRPVTLLVAFGIVLIIGLLISTGIAANHLRQQALSTTESELARIDGLVASATRLSLDAAGARLGEIAARLPSGDGGAAALREAAGSPDVEALMRATLGRSPRIDAVAIVAADGTVLASAGSWPAGNAALAALAKPPAAPGGRAAVLGSPVRSGNDIAIPLAHRIHSADGVPLGAVIGLLPATELGNLFAGASLPGDAAIVLLGENGASLARYPSSLGDHTSDAERANLDSVFHDQTATVMRHTTDSQGQWRIEALHAVPDYPAAVIVSRSADRALAGWQHQGLWFGGFALGGALVIGIVVYLIAHQFETHSTIAAIRAENIEAERARLAAEAELLKAERLSVLGQLTATVAHELRNPLSAIRNTLFTVKELTSTGGMKLDRPIARMERSIERCDRIISDLLEYTRHRELNRTSVPFDRWLSDVVGEQSIAEPVKVATELRAGDVAVPIDSDRVRRVVINLIENAAQALGETPADREKRITVRTATRDGEVVLAIEDTGPGISPENLARIFEPLFSTKSFGTGLGLPTVKQIVNQHDGTINVDSEVGQGTIVTVRLPLAEATTESEKVAA